MIMPSNITELAVFVVVTIIIWVMIRALMFMVMRLVVKRRIKNRRKFIVELRGEKYEFKAGRKF